MNKFFLYIAMTGLSPLIITVDLAAAAIKRPTVPPRLTPQAIARIRAARAAAQQPLIPLAKQKPIPTKIAKPIPTPARSPKSIRGTVAPRLQRTPLARPQLQKKIAKPAPKPAIIPKPTQPRRAPLKPQPVAVPSKAKLTPKPVVIPEPAQRTKPLPSKTTTPQPTTGTVAFENSAVSYDANPRHRPYMEDRYVVNTPQQIFGVFDGHGGQSAAQYIVDPKKYNGTPRIEALIIEQKLSPSLHTDAQALINSLKIIEQDLWEKDLQSNEYGYGTLLQWGRVRGLPLHESFYPELYNQTGSTAIIAKLTNTVLTIANVGDSRAVLIRNGRIIHTTQDHKPTSPTEQKRIEDAGGEVLKKRVWGGYVGLAVSRTIGDVQIKKDAGQSKNSKNPIISAVPDIYTWNIEAGDVLILATDGLWDVMDTQQGNNDNAVLQKLIDQTPLYDTYSPDKITPLLVQQAKTLHSHDNITVLAVKF